MMRPKPDNFKATAGVSPPSVSAPLWLLALITLSGTLAMHIFVPALPHTAHDLGASASAAQWTLSTYILGLALGQLTYGPISDHFGRRPVLAAGLIVYALASVAAMLAPNIEALITFRFIQALGGCSGLVLGRAIVRDTVSGDDAARKLSLMNLMVYMGPGLSPLIGSLLAETTGWRSIFVVLSLLGFFNLALMWRLLPETSGGAGHDTRTVLRSYRHLFASRRFLGYTIGGGCATTSLYAFIGAAPFIFSDQLHRPTHEIGLYLFLTIVVLCFGAGIASPTALAEAMSINPSIAGSASGLYGFAQMAIGALCTALGGLGGNHALAAALVLAGAGVIAQFAFWFADRRPT